MEDVERVNMLNGYQNLSKQLQNTLRGGKDNSLYHNEKGLPLFHLLLQQATIPLLNKFMECPPWGILHGNHQRLVLHEVVMVGYYVWVPEH